MTGLDGVALALAVSLLLTIPVFRVLARGRPGDPDAARRSKTSTVAHWLHEWMAWVVSPVERLAVRRRLPPELFNYVGLGFGAASGLAFAAGALPLGGLLVAFSGIADVVDGRVARARGVASHFGAFLDSTLDRFAETFAFLGIAWYFGPNRWLTLLVVAALGGSFLVSYARARGQAVGVDCTTGIMQRAERLVLLSLAALFDSLVTSRLGWPAGSLLAAAIGVIGLGSLSTAVYRVVFIARRLRA